MHMVLGDGFKESIQGWIMLERNRIRGLRLLPEFVDMYLTS